MQNIFQSAAKNSGIRLEMNDGVLAVIYPDSRAVRGYDYLILSNNVDLNDIHHLRLITLIENNLSINIKAPNSKTSTQRR
jgi:hypothetical protein